jgi:hypothetical protein
MRVFTEWDVLTEGHSTERTDGDSVVLLQRWHEGRNGGLMETVLYYCSVGTQSAVQLHTQVC